MSLYNVRNNLNIINLTFLKEREKEKLLNITIEQLQI